MNRPKETELSEKSSMASTIALKTTEAVLPQVAKLLNCEQ